MLDAEKYPVASAVRQIVVNKPGEICALIVMEKQFWCLRLFELDGGVTDLETRYAVLVEPIGNPQTAGVDLEKAKGLFRLSKREVDVVEVLVSGGTDKEIAQRLGISVETVRAYLKSVRAKLGVTTRTAVVSLVHSLQNEEQSPG